MREKEHHLWSQSGTMEENHDDEPVREGVLSNVPKEFEMLYRIGLGQGMPVAQRKLAHKISTPTCPSFP